MVRLRRMIALVVAVLFAASASLYAASVPDVAAATPPHVAAGSAGNQGGCHGSGEEDEAPVRPSMKSSCCDIACHAWLPPTLPDMPLPPPAASAPVTRIVALDPRPSPGIERPPRA